MTEREQWEVVAEGVRRRVTVDGQRLMLVEVEFEPGAVGAQHRHEHEQATRVLRGRVRFSVDGRESLLQAGDSIHIPSNAWHGVVALEASALLDVFSPPRAEFRSERVSSL